MTKNIIYFFITLSITLISNLYSVDPFAGIETGLKEATNSLVTIVQIIAILALVLFGGYSLFSGNLDKNRLVMIITGILIISGASLFVDFIKSWVN